VSPRDDGPEIKLEGFGASPGICIGKAYLVDAEGSALIPKYLVPERDRPAEVKRFKTAVSRARSDLHRIIERVPEDAREHAHILETHLVLLKDKMLYGRVLQTIEREGINAEWALKMVAADVKTMFMEMADDYLRQRSADIAHVAERIMHRLVGTGDRGIGAIDKRVILVARDLSPADTSQIQLERVKGFVTDRGGVASHTSIIARTLELPAVQGLDRATSLIRNDDLLIVDGTAGIVIIRPAESTLVHYAERQLSFEAQRAEIARTSRLPATTLDGVGFGILGNIELPEEVVAVRNYGGEGIGLYRTEFQYLCCPTFPSEEALFEKYRDVVEVMAPHPVTIRTLDINGDKRPGRGAAPDEPNPALGLRAIRYCLKRPEVFLPQLRAILRAAVLGPVRILFPLISSIEEVRAAKALLHRAGAELQREGVPHDNGIAVGIMIEVPSAAIMADTLAREVDFFSIGTNDLIQYTLAVDRGNPQVGHLHNPLHPAILRLLKGIASAARQAGRRVFMCGEMAGEPLYTGLLLGLGIDELSMHPQAIPAVKGMVRNIRLEEARAFAAEALTLESATAVAERVNRVYGDLVHRRLPRAPDGQGV
jgi:phosphotransferase system enzyme I (PtsI)